MENLPRSTPKDVFMHLFNIVTFYLSVVGFIVLFVNYVNELFPDTLNYYFTAIANGVRWSSSILFVAVPAYLLTSWLLARDLHKEPKKREMKLRKWLIYFTLFISAITIVVDLMIFVYNFLDGELTVRFFLKVLVVLLVAGAVFGYYIWELKRSNAKTSIPKILTIIVTVVVLASIIWGFFIVGTPWQQRARKMDEQRVNDLQTLQYQIIDYWNRKNSLPAGLALLQDNISGFSIPQDPETKFDYEYKVVENLKFELCANFKTSDKDFPARGKDTMYNTPYGAFQQNWEHETGRICFERTIDPELYKTDIKTPMMVK